MLFRKRVNPVLAETKVEEKPDPIEACFQSILPIFRPDDKNYQRESSRIQRKIKELEDSLVDYLSIENKAIEGVKEQILELKNSLLVMKNRLTHKLVPVPEWKWVNLGLKVEIPSVFLIFLAKKSQECPPGHFLVRSLTGEGFSNPSPALVLPDVLFSVATRESIRMTQGNNLDVFLMASHLSKKGLVVWKQFDRFWFLEKVELSLSFNNNLVV